MSYEEYVNNLLERTISIKNDTKRLIDKIDMGGGGCWCNNVRWAQADLMAILHMAWSLEVAIRKFNEYHQDVYYDLNHYYGRPPELGD